MLVCSNGVVQCMLYIFLSAYILPYVFPNHALNWECSKVEHRLFGKCSQMKKGEIHFYEKSYHAYCLFFKLLITCNSSYILYWDFLLMTKRGRSNEVANLGRNVNIVLAILFILMLCALLVIIACIIFNNNVLPIAKLLFMLFMFDYIILSTLNILLKVLNLNIF